jgi:hypothetical protein
VDVLFHFPSRPQYTWDRWQDCVHSNLEHEFVKQVTVRRQAMYYDVTLWRVRAGASVCVCPAINLEQVSAYRKTRIPIANSFSHAQPKAKIPVRCPADWHGVGTAPLPLYQQVRDVRVSHHANGGAMISTHVQKVVKCRNLISNK